MAKGNGKGLPNDGKKAEYLEDGDGWMCSLCKTHTDVRRVHCICGAEMTNSPDYIRFQGKRKGVQAVETARAMAS